MEIAEGIMLTGLLVLSIFDLRTRKIPVLPVVFLGTAALIYRVATGAGCLELIIGILPGVFLLLLAYATRESIGYGDGLVIGVLGLFCGAKQAMAVLGMAFVFSAALSILLLAARRAGRKTELPFLPCLWAGYLLCLVW